MHLHPQMQSASELEERGIYKREPGKQTGLCNITSSDVCAMPFPFEKADLLIFPI